MSDWLDREIASLYKEMDELNKLNKLCNQVPDPFTKTSNSLYLEGQDTDYYGNKLPPKLRLIKGGKYGT